MKTLNVHFINTGWGNDHGVREAELLEITVNEAGTPIAKITNPFDYYTAELTARFLNTEWVCDLD
jgi:hypothetical protein